MAREGEIDVDDADIQDGSLDAVGEILTAFGYRATATSIGELFLTSSSDGPIHELEWHNKQLQKR